MLIVELEGGRVHRLGLDGELSQVFGDGSKSYSGDGGPFVDATYNGMRNIAGTPNGDFYFADDQSKAIRKYDPVKKTVQTVLGRGYGDEKLQLLNPHGVCWQQGWLYIVDTSHNRILRLKPAS